MKEIDNFSKLKKFKDKEVSILKKIKDTDNIKILLSNRNSIYKNIFGDRKLSNISKKDTTSLLLEYKEYLLSVITKESNIKSISSDDIILIEKANKLDNYSLLEYKIYYENTKYKIPNKSYLGIFSKILRETYKNQTFKQKLKLTDKEKIFVNCCIQSYHFSQKNNSFRPQNFKDPKTGTTYEYIENLSDINKSIWKNTDKNLFKNKTIIIAYRGTGVSESMNHFSIKGNGKRDFCLDSLIGNGKISKSTKLKKILEDFDKIIKKIGNDFDVYITGHSLGGRLAFEIHRNRYKKIEECRVFNPAFGCDLKYLHDVKLSQKREYPWEKNVYTYHIGGKLKNPGDDDIVSVLSGGYGKSYTFYTDFKEFSKGHGILNFVEKK